MAEIVDLLRKAVRVTIESTKQIGARASRAFAHFAYRIREGGRP